MAWTDERVERLRTMWDEGLTASQIATELGGVSRNAVIGKAHRLGLGNRNTKSPEPVEDMSKQPQATPEQKPVDTDVAEVDELAGESEECSEAPNASPVSRQILEQNAENRVEAKTGTTVDTNIVDIADEADEQQTAAALAAEVEKNARKLSLLELTERTCKWPIGDPSTSDFYFCGLKCAPDKPYCEAHAALAYQPMSSRRDRDKGRPRNTRAISA